MTVEELIKALLRVSDKTLPVVNRKGHEISFVTAEIGTDGQRVCRLTVQNPLPSVP